MLVLLLKKTTTTLQESNLLIHDPKFPPTYNLQIKEEEGKRKVDLLMKNTKSI